METIYWIQRLGYINTVAWIVFGFSIVSMIVSFVIIGSNYEFIDTLNECERWYNVGKKSIKVSSWVLGISLLFGIFIPSEKDLYIIYGVGGTIDYIRSNDTAKQLPDKVVNAIDAWISNQIDDNKE